MADQKSSHPQNACPGSAMRQWQPESEQQAPTVQTDIPDASPEHGARTLAPAQSELGQWPVQLMLVPTHAPYFKEADLAITADCIPFAYGNYHQEFLKGRPLVVGCPKLDEGQVYVDRLAEIFSLNNLKGIEVLVMEVPCCSGLIQITLMAKEKAGVTTPVRVTTIGVRGEHFGTKTV